MIPGLWPASPEERIFRAVADISRQMPKQAEAPRRYSTLPPKERAARNARNKAARKSRRQNRGK